MESSFSGSKIKYGEACKFKFPVHCPKEIEITAGDLDLSGVGCVNSLFINKEGDYYITNKADLCRYLYNYMVLKINLHLSNYQFFEEIDYFYF